MLGQYNNCTIKIILQKNIIVAVDNDDSVAKVVHLPVRTHILSVMLHCCGGASVVVVKGEIKMVVAPLDGVILWTGGVSVRLLI